MLRESALMYFWGAVILICSVFIASHLAGCAAVSVASDLAVCAAHPRDCN